jgi:hypothetical protein
MPIFIADVSYNMLFLLIFTASRVFTPAGLRTLFSMISSGLPCER